MACVLKGSHSFTCTTTDLYKYSMPDAVPPIHAVSSHVATDKGPSIDGGKFKFRKTNGRRIGIRFPVFILTYVYSSACHFTCLQNYNEISGGHNWRGLVRRRCSAGPVLPLCTPRVHPPTE